MEKAEAAKVLLGYSGGRLPGRSLKEKDREEEKLKRKIQRRREVEEGRGKRDIRQDIAQEVVAGIKGKGKCAR